MGTHMTLYLCSVHVAYTSSIIHKCSGSLKRHFHGNYRMSVRAILHKHSFVHASQPRCDVKQKAFLDAAERRFYKQDAAI